MILKNTTRIADFCDFVDDADFFRRFAPKTYPYPVALPDNQDDVLRESLTPVYPFLSQLLNSFLNSSDCGLLAQQF